MVLNGEPEKATLPSEVSIATTRDPEVTIIMTAAKQRTTCIGEEEEEEEEEAGEARCA